MSLERIATGDEFGAYKPSWLRDVTHPLLGDLEDCYAEQAYLRYGQDLPELKSQLMRYAKMSYAAVEFYCIGGGAAGIIGGVYAFIAMYAPQMSSVLDVIKGFEVLRGFWANIAVVSLSLSALCCVSAYRNFAFSRQCCERLNKLKGDNHSKG